MKRIVAGDRPVIPNGIYEGMPMDVYHDDPALSKSGLLDLRMSGAHYKAGRENERSTRSLTIGGLAHTAILEPDTFDDRYTFPPASVLSKSGAMAGNEYHAWRAEQEASGRQVVKYEMIETAMRMRDAVLENPAHSKAAELLRQGVKEVSFFVSDPLYEIRLKVRPDNIPCDGILVDLKTARSAFEPFFGADAARYCYHWSAWMSCHVVTLATENDYGRYYFVVVESDPPFEVAVFECPRHQQLVARAQIEPLIYQYKYFYDNNIWPGYPNLVRELALPKRAYWTPAEDEDSDYSADY